MLTGPVTMLMVLPARGRVSRGAARQLALAIRDEVVDLGPPGIRIVQIDEAASAKACLRRNAWPHYLE